MITVSLTNVLFQEGIIYPETQNGKISVVVSGHSGAFKKGNDIICSAVSALAQTLALSVKALAKIQYPLFIDEGLLEILIDINGIEKEKKDILTTLLGSFVLGITEIIKTNPNRIKIEFSKEEI